MLALDSIRYDRLAQAKRCVHGRGRERDKAEPRFQRRSPRRPSRRRIHSLHLASVADPAMDVYQASDGYLVQLNQTLNSYETCVSLTSPKDRVPFSDGPS